jgi:hypothetical protein
VCFLDFSFYILFGGFVILPIFCFLSHFCFFPFSFFKSAESAEPGMSDHEIVIANINIGAQRQHRPERIVYQYKKGNMDDMRMDMKEFSDKFCEQDHRTNYFVVAHSWFNLKIVDKILTKGTLPSKIGKFTMRKENHQFLL